MNNKMSSSQIEVQSLSQEISDKSIFIARLQANLYKMADENDSLKKKLKAKTLSKSKSKRAK